MDKIETGRLRNSIIVTNNSNTPITITLPTVVDDFGRQIHIEYKNNWNVEKVDKRKYNKGIDRYENITYTTNCL